MVSNQKLRQLTSLTETIRHDFVDLAEHKNNDPTL